ncbi:DUF3325 family protein [Vibrio kasasachensis]|uniref:DUF3325 family protein n=1 Tax=Vibrio kasasachensis TaxID=2910248 RepID=UPI003D1386DE
MVSSILFGYLSLLIFASATKHHRDEFWGNYSKAKPLKSVHIYSIRGIALIASAISIDQISLVYGVTVGIANWICLVTLLACLVVVTLSYALRSLFTQICLSGMLAGFSLAL